MSELAEFEQLMADVMAGSEEAVWTLAKDYSHHIAWIVRDSLPPQLRSKLDSQDIVQTLWASILLGRTDLTRLKSPNELIAYLARCAKNKLIDKTRHFRNQKRNVDLEERLEPEHKSPQKPSEHQLRPNVYSREPSPSTYAIFREQLDVALSACSKRDQDVLQMTLNGCSIELVAERLQIDERTARRAIHRIVDKMSG